LELPADEIGDDLDVERGAMGELSGILRLERVVDAAVEAQTKLNGWVGATTEVESA